MKLDLNGIKGYTSIVTGLVAVAILCCLVCCCSMLRNQPQEEEPAPAAEEPQEDPVVEEVEPIELEGITSEEYLPMVILFRCAVCRQDKEDSHQVSIDGKVIGEVCSDCAQIVIGVLQR